MKKYLISLLEKADIKIDEHRLHYYTNIMDKKYFELGGLKMLYSSTLLSGGELSDL